MSEKEHKVNRQTDVKIQSRLPIRTVGIETERERKNFTHLPPQNYLHTWWARRPTPATRLAILASIVPEDIEDDTLLRWIGIDPDNLAQGNSISEHVQEKKKTKSERSGSVYDHYGYRKVWTSSPSANTKDEIHELAKETWDDLPTVLDATAGGGTIPFESIRYDLPTIANELNPVASTILKGVLEHPRVNGDLSDEIRKWGEEINKIASERLSEFFPGSSPSSEPTNYITAHTISCPDCGFNLPLAPNWWIDKSSDNNVAAKPKVKGDSASFDIVDPDNFDGWNPSDGTVSYGKAECLNCGVTVEAEEVREQARAGAMGYQLFCIEYKSLNDDSRGQFRSPNADDIKALENAREKVKNSPELSSFLTEPTPPMHNKYDVKRYGMEEWRDFFTPRQLLTNYEYLQAYYEVKEEIESEYDSEISEVILTFLSYAADKAISLNCRQSRWDSSVPKLVQIFDRHDFAFKWSFGESNLTAQGLGFEWVLENVLTAYGDLKELSGDSKAPSQVLQGDAADLPLENGEVQAVILDPPYYDNVMYSELSDFFYVWLKQYLGDVYPDFFTTQLTPKDNEAVAKPFKFEGIASESSSREEMAKEDYEDMMSSIFKEMHRVLSDDGIFTLMFTHKKTEAWDTLTTALIESGFVVNATHPISTENPHSLHQSGKNSAESTILLSSEKKEEGDEEYTLWSDVKEKTHSAAKSKAKDLDAREVEFTKVDMILASFGPTLEVFTSSYPVVNDEGDPVAPQEALDEARSAVRSYLIEQYLNNDIREVDTKTEWYVLSWLIFEAKRFPYDEARRLALGVGEDLTSLKKTHRMWRKRSGDVLLRPHEDRVQDINKSSNNRSGRKPVDPDALSFATALDKVHAAIHIYDAQGATEAWNWMRDRNCGSDPAFKATLEALLRVLPHNHDDWKIARNLAAGETGELLDLDLDADIFKEDDQDGDFQGSLDDF